MSGLHRGDRQYLRAVLAMVAAGLASFNTLYATQALLPTLTQDLGISPSQAALTISATTGALAVCIVPASILSERFGRGRILSVSVVFAVGLGLVLPWLPSIEAFIIGRTIQGILLAGVPAVAMAWISEEVRIEDLGHMMGLYVAGTSIGGLLGRLIPATAVEFMPWQNAVFVNGCIALTFAVLFVWLLPSQQRFHPKTLTFRSEFRIMVMHWKNPKLAALFISGFLNMGAFVSLYNYLGYRMVSQFHLSEAVTGSLFLLFLSGTWSSTTAATLVARFGTANTVVGLVITSTLGLIGCASTHFGITMVALLLFTASFFALHSTASGAIGKTAISHRAEATSMYLFCYYCGSSVLGWVSGYIFSYFGWAGLICGLLFLMTIFGTAAVYFANKN
ncbi:MFS transporter [Corynebacterium freiburgense]|uniref:MFS transporter n=1 Tax=Corynebacterium freiburgense TaxID=556548 RepID=UPI00040B0596|nr:MFS transporter [Corynebacterium freiburgense]WJZ03892.1 Inner membrane transport protein YnfM [Corynebacterium freiburgense]